MSNMTHTPRTDGARNERDVEAPRNMLSCRTEAQTSPADYRRDQSRPTLHIVSTTAACVFVVRSCCRCPSAQNVFHCAPITVWRAVCGPTHPMRHIICLLATRSARISAVVRELSWTSYKPQHYVFVGHYVVAFPLRMYSMAHRSQYCCSSGDVIQ